MHMNAVMLCGNMVLAGRVLMMIEDVVVVLIMMIIMTVCIQGDSMDGVTGLVTMVVGMGRRGRNEAIACKSKRQAEGYEAPERSHVYILAKNRFA